MVSTDEQELGPLLRSDPRPLMRCALLHLFPRRGAFLPRLTANFRPNRQFGGTQHSRLAISPGARFDEQVRGVNAGNYARSEQLQRLPELSGRR